MDKTTTEEARSIAALYVSPSPGDVEMTRFATTGRADGWLLLECIERNDKQAARLHCFDPETRAVVKRELDYLRQWVREYHGRYAVTVYARTYAEWQEGEDEPRKTGESEATFMFDTYREVADYLRREGAEEASVYPGPYTLDTWVSATYDDPTGGREDKTFHPAHGPNGLTERGWNAILRAALAR